MGLVVILFVALAITGSLGSLHWLRSLHYFMGLLLVGLILFLLAIGIVGTIGHFGNLGHSQHLAAGLAVVFLVLASAWAAHQIQPPPDHWARKLHFNLNLGLFLALAWVSLSGWHVVQKYLSP